MAKAKPRKKTQGFAFAVGKTYLNRFGAKVRIEEVRDSGHQRLDARTYKPNGKATLLILKTLGVHPGIPRGYALCGCCGCYFPHDEEHCLDLVKELK